MCSDLGSAISGLGQAVGCFSTYALFRCKTATELDLNVSVLGDEMRNLEVSQKEVEDEKTLEEKNGNKVIPKVDYWLDQVKDFVIVEQKEKASAKVNWLKKVEEYVTVKGDKEKPRADSLNSCDLYKANEVMKAKIEKIKELRNDADKFKNNMIDTKSFRPVEDIGGATIQGQVTAQDTLNKVKKLLNADSIWSIGIWGLAGIGKTTLVRTLNNELMKPSKQTKPFTVVIWAEVSYSFDKDDDQCLQLLQTRIANRLKVQIGADMGRQLHQRLMNENFLLILVDVWKKIDLSKLGIPRHENGKIILTTRFQQVCREMKTDEDVKMNLLTLEEAEQLFRQKAKYDDVSKIIISRRIKTLAKKVVKKCSGLPLAIDSVGAFLYKCDDVGPWEHVIDKLQTPESPLPEIANKVYKPLSHSYEALSCDTEKSCFMHCSLFPQGSSIKKTELVIYWMAEGLIKVGEDYMASVNEGYNIIKSLKDSCLLEDGDKEGTVKMHDLVRDVAIWIASTSEDGCQSLVSTGNVLTKLPDSADSVKCHNNLTQLQLNGSLDTVLDGFLERFKAARFLNLSSTNIRSLPSSLHRLSDLRALILRECKSLEDLRTLEGLCNLQMLDLHASGVRELPIGMEKLSNLRQLDLSNTGKLKTIKAGIISSLTSLQVLDMRGSSFDFCVKGKGEKEQTTFEELKDVDRLCNLYIKLQGIPEDLSWIDRLKEFQIFIGPKAPFTTTSLDKMLVIGCPDLKQESIKQLRSIASLESLTISHCQVEKCPSESSDPPPNTNRESRLSELHLRCVSDLESIGHLGLNFHNLISIKVHNCSDMKYLLSCVDSNRTLRTLPSLEEIQVGICSNLEELFNYGSGQNMASDPVVPKLRKLKLWGLYKLSTLSRQKETWPRLEEVEVSVCPRLIRLPLTNQNAETIKEIRGESHWWNALKWDDDETKSSLQHKFRHWRPTKLILRYPFYDLQHFFSQRQRSILNKTLGDEDFVSCFLCRSIGLVETDEITERDSVKGLGETDEKTERDSVKEKEG